MLSVSWFLVFYSMKHPAFWLLFRKMLFKILYFWLCWVFVASCGISVVAESGSYWSCSMLASHRSGFSCCRAQALGSWASVVVAYGLSSSVACGIFLDQGSNPCPLQILIHCTTREVQEGMLIFISHLVSWKKHWIQKLEELHFYKLIMR